MDNLKVLIVEDDPNLGQILSEYLDIKGLNTTLCSDGEEGLSTYNHGKFDLCILDIMMPKRMDLHWHRRSGSRAIAFQ